MFKSYRVTWEIEVYADSPREAARICRDIQLDPGNQATHYGVKEEDTVNGYFYDIDLAEKEI